jgi:hypothetical protein
LCLVAYIHACKHVHTEYVHVWHTYMHANTYTQSMWMYVLDAAPLHFCRMPWGQIGALVGAAEFCDCTVVKDIGAAVP